MPFNAMVMVETWRKLKHTFTQPSIVNSVPVCKPSVWLVDCFYIFYLLCCERSTIPRLSQVQSRRYVFLPVRESTAIKRRLVLGCKLEDSIDGFKRLRCFWLNNQISRSQNEQRATSNSYAYGGMKLILISNALFSSAQFHIALGTVSDIHNPKLKENRNHAM